MGVIAATDLELFECVESGEEGTGIIEAFERRAGQATQRGTLPDASRELQRNGMTVVESRGRHHDVLETQ